MITTVGVSANNPPVLVQPNTKLDTSVTTAISPVILTETSKGAIPNGFVCVEANIGNYFLTDSHLAPVGIAQTNPQSGAVLGSSEPSPGSAPRAHSAPLIPLASPSR